MFFVVGITGKVGGATARRLLDEGHEVRALVRDRAKSGEWSQRGVERREGDLTIPRLSPTRERFYNSTRRHSTLGYLSPMDFERQAQVA